MHRVGRLNVREGGDDHPPDALGGVERQDAAMSLDQPAHHLGFARRPECRSGFLGALGADQPVDDLAALDEKRMHCRVDPIDRGAA